MSAFQDFKISKQLLNAIDELGFQEPTPIQDASFSVLRSGKDVVGIAQTGTGKTLAYMLPILQDLKYADQIHPRVLVLVPTRELVLQVVEQIKSLALYLSVRVQGVYGGTNINTQKIAVSQGCDIVVATPGRLRDLALSNYLQLKGIKKLVIDEVDVMLDLGFRFQLTAILDLLPNKRQNIMYSATMTDEVDALINDFFRNPTKISIAVSGTPLDNISQQVYHARNFYTKANLLAHLIRDKEEFSKVLVFISTKKSADRLFDTLAEEFNSEIAIIHSNKSQNYRIRSIEQFDQGANRILIATDVMARGLDLDKISHVINFDTPKYPENYMHRIGRTGRAKEQGKAILFYSDEESIYKDAIESLMSVMIPTVDFPEGVEISSELTPEERPKSKEINLGGRESDRVGLNSGFHEKKAKNRKTNQGGSYRRIVAKKYKKSQTRGDKIRNMNKKKKK